MKLSDVITRVKRQFGDELGAQITVDDIVRWSNDALLEIVSTNKTNQGALKGVTSIIAGKSEYELPADLLSLRSVRANGRPIRHMSYEQVTQLEEYSDTDTGTPTVYWVHDNNINVYPIPDSTLGSLDIYYVKTPDTLLATSLDVELDIPVQYHSGVVEYCIAQAAELDDDLGHYQMKMNQFKSKLSEMKQNDTPENGEFYASITYVMEY